MTPPTIDQSVIERLSALLEAATLDRWKHEPIYRGGQLVRNSIVADGREIAYDVNDARDADLIVAMKNALPAILASISPSPIAGKEDLAGMVAHVRRLAVEPRREEFASFREHLIAVDVHDLRLIADTIESLATPPAECVAAPGEIQAEAVAGRAQMIAAYRGPVVSFNVDDDRYYLASCDACGWVGSTELCPHDEEDVICPRCFASGADCGTVAEKIASRPATLLTQMEAREQAMREALEATRLSIVTAIAFLNRDAGSEREAETVNQAIANLAVADADIRALLNPTPTEER
jgi:hypothetical protein